MIDIIDEIKLILDEMERIGEFPEEESKLKSVDMDDGSILTDEFVEYLEVYDEKIEKLRNLVEDLDKYQF